MQRYKTIYVLSFLIFLISPLRAQTAYSEVATYEDELKVLFDSMFLRNEIRFLRTDKEKMELNENLTTIFREALEKKESFDYPFNKLVNCGILKSPDNRVKIYNWNLRFSDGSYRYYGFIQYYHPKLNEVFTWELTDASDSMPEPETKMEKDQLYTSWMGRK
jgi:hypothetical protein